jgi:signal transduction histidine kinase
MHRHLIAAALAVVLPLAAHAEERATTKEAEGMVHQAVAFLQKEGKDKAFAAFDDPKGPFTYRDLYIAAYDLTGKCVAHGAKKERIGKIALDEKDADGKLFVKERIELAKGAGKGWQEYKFANPTSKKVEQKVAYLERVGDVILVCGAYKP